MVTVTAIRLTPRTVNRPRCDLSTCMGTVNNGHRSSPRVESPFVGSAPGPGISSDLLPRPPDGDLPRPCS